MKRSKLMAILLATLMLLAMLPFSVSASADVAAADLNALAIPSVICGTYELPTETENGTTFAWACDKIGVLSGATVAAGRADKAVTLTATATNNGATATQTFDVLVKRDTVVYYEGFEAAAGTNVDGYNGWFRNTPGATNTSMTIEAESETSDNMVMKLHKSANEAQTTNYLSRNMDKTLTQKKDFIFSAKMFSVNDSTVMDLRASAQWQQVAGETLRVEEATYQTMFNLRFYYKSNAIEYTCVDPISGYDNRDSVFIASGCLKVGVWQTIEIQADYDEQAFWLVIDGEKVTSQPLPYERKNVHGLVTDYGYHVSGSRGNRRLGTYGYDAYWRDAAIHEFRMTLLNHQHGAGKETILLVDDVELAVDEAIDSMDRAIDVEYNKTDYAAGGRITFSPYYSNTELWRVVGGAENAGKKAIVALYGEGGTLLACPQVTIDEAGFAVFNQKITSDVKDIKVFLWDSMETLQPISESFTEKVR